MTENVLSVLNSFLKKKFTFLISERNGGIECDHCGRMFRTKQLIKEHLIRIFKGGYNRAPPKRPAAKKNPSRIYTCDICESQHISKDTLDEHYLVTHSNIPLSFVCTICLRSFDKRSTLKLHIYNKHSDRPKILYRCSYCPKTFKSKRSQEYHETIHTGSTKYKCPDCSKGLKTKQAYNDHILIHTGELNFLCTFCQKPFRTRQLLRSHSLVHSNLFKHSCEICGLRFRRATNLAEHMLVHTDERNYECGICETKFKAKMSMKRHMKQHERRSGLEGNSIVKTSKVKNVIGNSEKNIAVSTNDN